MAKNSEFRTRQRRLAFMKRGGAAAKCDYCGTAKATDYHEIINRGRSMNNEDLRELSYDHHICSCLCSNCHINVNVHRPDVATTLLERNIERFGYDAVKEAWDTACERLIGHMAIQFPERENAFSESEDDEESS